MTKPLKVFVGCMNGLTIYASETLAAKVGLQTITDEFRTTKRFPVNTDLSGNTVYIAANSQEEAVSKYLMSRRRKEQND